MTPAEQKVFEQMREAAKQAAVALRNATPVRAKDPQEQASAVVALEEALAADALQAAPKPLFGDLIAAHEGLSEELKALDAPAPQAEQPLTEEADMFWDNDDPEECHGSIDELLNTEWCNGSLEVGDTFTVQRAVRQPNITVTVTSVSDTGDVGYKVEAAHGITGEAK